MASDTNFINKKTDGKESPTKFGIDTVRKEELATIYGDSFERMMRHGRFRVKRRMRRKNQKRMADCGVNSISLGQGDEQDKDLRVKSVLLEYGHFYSSFNQSIEDQKKTQASASRRKDNDGDKQREKDEEEVARLLRDEMENASGALTRISGSAAKKIVSFRRDELQQAVARYEDDVSAGNVNNSNHKQQVDLLTRQISAQQQQLDDLNETLARAVSELKEAERVRALADEHRREIQHTYDKLFEAVHSLGTDEEIEKLLALGTENKDLMKTDHAKRTEYQRRLEEMEAQIESGTLMELDSEELDDINNVDSLTRVEEEKRDKIRAGLARIGREVAFFNRKVEDMPTQPELFQYNRRFTELYEQVVSTLEENKRYYESYNVLIEQQKFVTKEIKLQNSIKAQYDDAVKTSSGRNALVESLKDIAKGVQATVNSYKKKLDDQKAIVTTLKERMNQINVRKREYLSKIQELQEQYYETEILMRASK